MICVCVYIYMYMYTRRFVLIAKRITETNVYIERYNVMNWFVFYRFALSTIRFQTKAFYLNLMVTNLYKKNKIDDDDQIIFFLILENKLMLLYSLQMICCSIY